MPEELQNFRMSGWMRLETIDVITNDLICDCNCPNKSSPSMLHVIRVMITRKEERMCFSEEGLIKLKADRVQEGRQNLIKYKCPEA